MGNIDFFAACVASFPEALVIMITSFFLVGRRDLLNIKRKENLLRILSSAVLMTLIVALAKNYMDQWHTIITVSADVLIWTLILRIHWVEAIVGILATLVAFVPLEYVSILIGCNAIGVHFDGRNIDGRLWMYLNVLTRLLEIILAVILYKIPFTIIKLGTVKNFTRKKQGKILLICLQQAFFILVILKIARFDYPFTKSGMQDMIINIILVIAVVVVNIRMTVNLLEGIRNEKWFGLIELLWVDSLLKKPDYDKIRVRQELRAHLEKAVKDFEREGGKMDER